MSNATKFKIVGTSNAPQASGYDTSGDEPEGTILITVKCIGNWARFGHYIVDVLAVYAYIFLIGFTLAALNVDINWEAPGIGYLFGGFAIITYYSTFEYFTQRSLGKMLTRCIVIDQYGQRPSFSTILRRSASRLVPFEVFSCLGSEGRGWHDKWSNTFVIPAKEMEQINSIISVEEIGAPVFASGSNEE